MKNQVFLDRMDQYKISNNPLYLTIDNEVLEDKFTLTKRIDNVPSWLRVNSLMSANIRRTRSRTTSGFGGDIMANRPDITDPYWNDYINGRTPNTTFETAADNGDLDNGGTPTRAAGETTYWEYGVGALFDIDLFDKLNLLIGTRYDYSKAENVEEAGTFNENTGTSASPGTYRSESSAEGSDSGTSWSASLSYRATPGVIPYVTFADASAALDSSSNRINSATIEHGHIGSSELVEAGIKLSGFDDALFFSLARYDQTRTNVSADEDDPTLGAYVTSTEARGVEAELKWIPKRGMSVSLFGLRQKIKYSPNTGANLNLSARALGFMDVVDPATGEVIYPAEAFLYGGRANIVLPDNMPEFQKWTNNPESQAGGYITYQFPRNIKGLSSAGFTFGGNYTSDVCSGRLCTITIPSVTTLNASVFGTLGSVYFKLDVTNLTDESFYRPRLNNNAADMLLQAMPGRRYALTARMSF
jgi:outer membrane receptor protein involved in Fe transport